MTIGSPRPGERRRQQRRAALARHFDSAVWLLFASKEHLPRRVRVVVDFLRGEIRELLGAGGDAV